MKICKMYVRCVEFFALCTFCVYIFVHTTLFIHPRKVVEKFIKYAMTLLYVFVCFIVCLWGLFFVCSGVFVGLVFFSFAFTVDFLFLGSTHSHMHIYIENNSLFLILLLFNEHI